MKTEQILLIKELSFSYGKKDVLRHLAFEAKAGEMIALVGLNGSGKSTLLKLIAGVNPSQEGEIYFCGENVTSWSTYQRVNHGLAFAMQGFRVFPSLTFMENLEVGTPGISDSELKRMVGEMLEKFPSLRESLTKRAGLLSGGQRKMLSILMQMIRRPKLLLLDEPLAGLDPKNGEQVLDLIKDYNASLGTPMIIVEHNLELVLPLVQRVIVLKNGEAIEMLRSYDARFEKRLEEVLLATDMATTTTFELNPDRASQTHGLATEHI